MAIAKHLNKYNIMWVCMLFFVYIITHGFVLYGLKHYIENLIPELTGMVIELLIVLFIFNEWQSREQNKQKISKEKRLREFLIFIINKFSKFDSMPPDFNFYGMEHSKNQVVLKHIISDLKSKKNIPEDFQSNFIEHCLRDIDALTSLLPVAADLSEEHFKSWARIVYYIKKNSLLLQTENASLEGTELDKFYTNNIELVAYIKRFDSASYNSNIYHGAI